MSNVHDANVRDYLYEILEDYMNEHILIDHLAFSTAMVAEVGVRLTKQVRFHLSDCPSDLPCLASFTVPSASAS